MPQFSFTVTKPKKRYTWIQQVDKMKEDLKVLLLTSAASAGIGVVCGLWVSSHFRLPWNSREKKSLCGGNLNVFAEALFFPDSGIQGFGDMKKSERDKLYVGASINSASLLKIVQLLNNATKRYNSDHIIPWIRHPSTFTFHVQPRNLHVPSH